MTQADGKRIAISVDWKFEDRSTVLVVLEGEEEALVGLLVTIAHVIAGSKSLLHKYEVAAW